MTLEPFFKQFDALADAPDAVAKTRELILNFAVTGRLSEQRAGDSPVSELLEMLSAARSRRARRGERVSSAPAVDSVLECPIRVPKHWAWISLAEIGTLSGGMTPSKTRSSFWNGDINWFSSKDVRPDELKESELKITREATEATRLQIYSPGCLIFVARSGILKRTFPVSILRVNGTVNQDLKVLCPFVSGLERYIQLMLRGMTSFILTSLVKTGMTVQSLKFEEFEEQPFPFPPLAEQKRIVAKVDALMALCDRLEPQQKERDTRHAALARASLARFADAPTAANLTFLFHKSYTIPPADLRKSILTLAVQGKLVPQDPSDEPAKAMNAKLPDALRAIADRIGVRFSKPDAFVEVDENLPKGWGFAAVRGIGVTQTGTTPTKSESHFTGRHVPFIKPGDIQGNEVDYENEGLSADGLAAGRLIPKHSILMVSIGGSIGKAAIVDRDVSCNQQINSVSVAECMDPYFVLTAIRSREFQKEVTRRAAQGTLPIISKGKWETIRIPIPPLAEQRRIVAKVDHLMALVNDLEAQLAASRTTAAKLLDAILGELTA